RRLRGTFAPARRASDRPIAIACLRLFTRLPERPLRSVPRLRSCIARLTFCCAFLPYLAMGNLLVTPCQQDLFDLGLAPQVLDQLVDLPLRELLLDALPHFGERRKAALAHVVELDDVEAEARAHRRLGVLALLELHHRLGEGAVEVVRPVPVEVA